MGQGAQKAFANGSRNKRVSASNSKTTRKNEKGQSQEQVDPPENLGNLLGKSVKRFVHFLPKQFEKLPDFRQKGKVTYTKSHLLWSGILLFLLHSKSKAQYRLDQRTSDFSKNLSLLSESKEQSTADPDTIDYFLRGLPHENLEEIPHQIVTHLIRSKSLEIYRLYDHYLIAIDGTGIRKYDKRHCEECLSKTSKKTGKTTYYHGVLEAKLVTQTGISLSIATETIENKDKNQTKQDCEIKAFKRLAPKIKKYFPRLKICLLLDALYFKSTIFKICQDSNWKYIVNFKEGSACAFYEETRKEKQRRIENRKTIIDDKTKITQKFAWVNNLKYQDTHSMQAIYCNEWQSKKKKTTDYAWVTNLKEINEKNVNFIANGGGRVRWQLEESFNIQKNGGYELEHPYSFDNNASMNWYYLMQIAHSINQLITKSNLFKNFKKQMGSLRNFAKRLAEHLRYIPIDPKSWTQKAFQIRLNSS